jgi:arylsulfatase A-like enzyme
MVISVEPPHPPFEAPKDLQAAWEGREIRLPPNFAAETEEQRTRFLLERRRYYAMVENLDWNVGRIVSFLKERGLADETVVVFLSDHGELGGAHGLRSKQWPYEESVGIPLIVRDPRSGHRAGAVIEDPVCTEDLFPTFLGLAGLSHRNTLPGSDLTELIRGGADRLPRDGVMLEFVAELRQNQPFYDEVWRGFRTAYGKYTVKGNNLGGRPWQFFDLRSDPWETKNLVDDPAWRDEAARHHGLLVQRMVETEDHFVLDAAFGCGAVNAWKA